MYATSPTFERDCARAEPSDFCSREGGAMLKQRIEAYWAARGQNVTVSLQIAPFHPTIRAARFDVRSDMVNGMPRNAAAPAPKLQEVFIDDFGDAGDVEWSPAEMRRAG